MDDSHKEMRAHVWQYFSTHAAQRVSMFNFFLLLAGLIAAGLAACLQTTGTLELVGGVMGLFLALVALVFYKLDARTSFLIKHAEGAMVTLEEAFAVPKARLFTSEIPKAIETGSLLPRLGRMWTYGFSLRLVFVITGVAGLAGGVLSLLRYLGVAS